MPTLPSLNSGEVVQAFVRGGWMVKRQRGSHILLVKSGNFATLSVPDHRPVAKGTLRSLIRSSGMTVEQFNALRS